MRRHTQTSPDAPAASASRNGLLPRAIRWRACLGLLLAGASLSATAATNTVECDFSTRLKVGPMNGILEGWDGENPSDELISRILNPGDYARIFIYHEDAVKRAIQMGCRVAARLDRYERMTGKQPFDDWPAWKQWCADLAAKWGTNVIYDVWNEPDSKDYWYGTKTQLFETYVAAHDAIKSVVPDARMSGPGVAGFSKGTFIRAFLDYCKAHSAKCEVLQWHEFVDANVPQITNHLAYAKSQWLNNPAYASVGIEELFIGESVNWNAHYRAGVHLAYFYYMEKGGADGACNSTWSGDNEKRTLSGLLQRDTRLPRASYYVFEEYAKGVAYRVDASTDNPAVIAVPAWQVRGDTNQAQVLISYHSGTPSSSNRSADKTCDVVVNLNHLRSIPFLADQSQCSVQVHKIEDAGNAPYAGLKPVPAEDEQLTLDAAGNATVMLNGVGLNEVWRLTIRP